MKRRNIKSAGVLLLGLLMLTTVNAQSPRQGARGQGAFGGGQQNDRPFARLDLSEEQQEKMTTLRTEHFKTMTPLKNKMVELKARERTLLSEEKVDMKAINLNIDEQSELMNSIKKLQVQHQIAVKDMLTDEQLMKLQQSRQYARRDGFHGKGARQSSGPAGSGRGYRGI